MMLLPPSFNVLHVVGPGPGGAPPDRRVDGEHLPVPGAGGAVPADPSLPPAVGPLGAADPDLVVVAAAVVGLIGVDAGEADVGVVVAQRLARLGGLPLVGDSAECEVCEEFFS